MQTLINAIKAEDIDTVRIWAPKVSDINQIYRDGCFYGDHFTSVQEQGLPPLCYAMNLEGKIREDIIAVLKQNGADIGLTRMEGGKVEEAEVEYENVYEYCLYTAFSRLDLKILEYLLENFEYENHEIQYLQLLLDEFCRAVPDEFKMGGKGYNILNYLLENFHLDLDLTYTFDDENFISCNLWMGFTRKSALDCLTLLHAKGKNLDVNFRNSIGRTAAHDFPDVESARLLVKNFGTNPELADPHGETPLFVATYGGKLGVAKFLVDECGCDVFRMNDDKETLFHAMAYQDPKSAVDFENFFVWLKKEKKLDPDAYDGQGYTPFHRACIEGRPDVAGYFLERGVDPNKKTMKNENALELVVSKGNLFPIQANLPKLLWEIVCLLFYYPEIRMTQEVINKLNKGFTKVGNLYPPPEFCVRVMRLFFARCHMQNIYTSLQNHGSKILENEEEKNKIAELLFAAISEDPLLVASDFEKLIRGNTDKDFLSTDNIMILVGISLRMYGWLGGRNCNGVYVRIAEQFFEKIINDHTIPSAKLAVLFFLCAGAELARTSHFYFAFAELIKDKHPHPVSLEEFSCDFNLINLIERYPDESVEILKEIQELYAGLISVDEEKLFYSPNPCANALRVAQGALIEKRNKKINQLEEMSKRGEGFFTQQGKRLGAEDNKSDRQGGLKRHQVDLHP